jgi:RNA polymerase sigma-70 factor (ECF subfamily)
MVGLYDALLELTGSPIVALHRAVALGKAEGPDAGLQALEEWRGHPSLVHLHLYYAVTGELHAREGEFSAAVCAYERALTCPCTEPERRFLKAKLQHARAIGDEK